MGVISVVAEAINLSLKLKSNPNQVNCKPALSIGSKAAYKDVGYGPSGGEEGGWAEQQQQQNPSQDWPPADQGYNQQAPGGGGW